MKLLLTEDDAQLGEALQAILVTNGYAVTWVRSAEDYSLRKKLGNELIGTVRGVGYVLESG